jgi:hypothetical protein
MSNGRNGSTTVAVPWYPVRPGFDYDYCIMCRNEVAEALRKAVASGVASYHVGSRGLVRFSIADLQGLLTFWTNAANDAALGVSSSIQSRRGVPCDC